MTAAPSEWAQAEPETSVYGWIITHDWLDLEAVRIIGPHDIPDSMIEALDRGDGELFAIFDNDGNLYYTGRILIDEPRREVDGHGEEEFGPLNDYGTPNAGATDICYFSEETGRWESL